MDWNLGFSAIYYAHFVDPDTWRDVDRLDVTGGSITRTLDQLRASASLDCIGYEGGSDRWIRVYLDAKQNDTAVHVPLFTGIFTSPGDDINGTLVQNRLDGFSVLKPCEDVLLDRGWYIPAGANAAATIKNLLSTTPAPLTVAEGAPELAETIIAEDGESALSMTEKVLTSIGWRLRLAGDGGIELIPQATEASAVYDPLDNDAVEPEISITQDWFALPNVFRAVSGDMVGVARDDNPGSPLSTVSRGREVWMEEDGVDLTTGETIAEYAVRRLAEEQERATTAQYNRRYNPDVMPGDIVLLNYPAQGLVGEYRVTSQNIELGHGAKTSEEVTSER